MGRLEKKCTKDCKDHLLIFKPIHLLARKSLETQHYYCERGSSRWTSIPKFNKNKGSLFDAFLLPQSEKQIIKFDNRKQVNNGYSYRSRYSNVEEKSELMVPRPNPKNPLCVACKLFYEDYLEHIESEQHKTIVKKSPFNKDIAQLSRMFNQNLNDFLIEFGLKPKQTSHLNNPHKSDLNQQIEESSKISVDIEPLTNSDKGTMEKKQYFPLQEESKSLKQDTSYYLAIQKTIFFQ